MEKSKIIPRDYQEETVQICLDYIQGPSKKPAIVVAPTASGKSIMLALLAHRLGKPILNIVPSKELLDQNYSKLVAVGGTATIYSASFGKKEVSELTFATMGSIVTAAAEFKAMGVEIVTVDECHFKIPPNPDSMFMKFIAELAPKKVIGFTATPFFLKNSMEGAELKFLTRMRPCFFKEVLHVIPISYIVENGFWAKLRYEAHVFDESELELNSSGSDFTQTSIIRANEHQNVNNRIFLRIREMSGQGRRILVFMDTVENAKKMAIALNQRGVCRAAEINAKTKAGERDEIIRKFRAGEIDAVINVGILTTGFDYPELDTVILGSATNSLSLYYQWAGRGTRIHPDKEECLICDFGGNIKRFGRVETLEIINYPGFGWGVFNNDVLLTNTNLKGLKVTKEMLDAKAKPVGKIWFGMHKDKNIDELPVAYMEWLLYSSNMNFTSANMSRLKKEMVALLERDKTIQV